MLTIDSKEINKRPMRLRHAVRDGYEVGLTFRSALYAAVVPWERYQRERAELAELAELRQRVAELEERLQGGREEATAS